MSNPTKTDTTTSAAEQAAATDDVALAYAALSAKATPYARLWNYYWGDQPQQLVALMLEKIFKRSDVRFTRNFCGVIIKSTADRIHLEGFEVVGNEEATKTLAALVDATDLLIEADDAHDGALVIGEAFVIVWPDEDGEPQVNFNDARLCHLFYESANPRKARMGAKWWVDELDGKLYLTLYYPDQIQYYVSDKKAENVTNAASFMPDPEQPFATNEYGLVPFFHLRPDRTVVLSDLKSALPIQDQINILATNLMISAGFGGSPTKWVISAVDTQGKVKNAPGEILDLPAGDGVTQGTQVGQFEATDLENFSKAMDEAIAELSAITSTPKFYFGGTSGDPSGEALITMESPLVMKARDRIDRFKLEWRRCASFLLLIKKIKIAPGQIKPKFADPRTLQPKTQAEIRQSNTAAGMPMVTQLRDEGKTPAEIDLYLKDKADEEAAQANTLAQALVSQQRQFDQGGANG